MNNLNKIIDLANIQLNDDVYIIEYKTDNQIDFINQYNGDRFNLIEIEGWFYLNDKTQSFNNIIDVTDALVQMFYEKNGDYDITNLFYNVDPTLKFRFNENKKTESLTVFEKTLVSVMLVIIMLIMFWVSTIGIYYILK